MAVAVTNPPCLSFCSSVAARTTVTKTEANTIRDRLLYKLGFYASPSFADAVGYHKNKGRVLSESDKQKSDRRPPWASQEEIQATSKNKFPPAPCLAPIKLGDEEAELCKRADANGPGRAPLAVRFHPSVLIMPIPSHRSYSSRSKARMYTPKEELTANAIRNNREFVYEGRDWRSVVEEEEMFICRWTGEYVHPAHVRYERWANPYLLSERTP